MARDNELDARALLDRIRQRTPARVVVGRFGGSYPTKSLLELRASHAAAKDAVLAECEFQRILGREILVANSLALTKEDYLLRPDLGRRFSPDAAEQLRSRCARGAQLQIVIGDGLSSAAVAAQVPHLLPLLVEGARKRAWSIGTTFAVRHCRVGVMNEIGDILQPEVVVLLIGERPGLATAESLSAYIAFRPRTGNSDADRNLISNIHARGTPPDIAAQRIIALGAAMMVAQRSGSSLKEQLPERTPTGVKAIDPAK